MEADSPKQLIAETAGFGWMKSLTIQRPAQTDAS